jgi:uncharacterized coiled-coil DUF342 family protein
MTPEREAELRDKGSLLTLEEEEECFNAIAMLRKKVEATEKALNEHWEKRFFALSEALEAATKRAERAEGLCKLLEEQWLKAAFTFRNHHKAVLGAMEKI